MPHKFQTAQQGVSKFRGSKTNKKIEEDSILYKSIINTEIKYVKPNTKTMKLVQDIGASKSDLLFLNNHGMDPAEFYQMLCINGEQDIYVMADLGGKQSHEVINKSRTIMANMIWKKYQKQLN